jgi:hypothetical protein
LLKGYSYASIMKHLPDDTDLTVRSIREHFARGHLPLDESVRRVVIEEHSKELGRDIETFESNLGNHITFARLGLQRALQAMGEGKMEPTVNQAIAMAHLLIKTEQVAGEAVDREIIGQLLHVIGEGIDRFVSLAEQGPFLDFLMTNNPLYQALETREVKGPNDQDPAALSDGRGEHARDEEEGEIDGSA